MQMGQVKDLCTACVHWPVCQYSWPLWDSKDLRNAMRPLLILPQMAAAIPCTKQDCPSPSPWQIDFVSGPWGLEEQSLWFCLLALSLWRTISLFIPPFLLPLKGLFYLQAPTSPPSSPLVPSDRLSDSKSATLIQHSAQVSWILLKSHFHFTSSLQASL